VQATQPGLADEKIIGLYQLATSGDDPDQIEILLIEPALRKLEIGTPSAGLAYVLKRKEGTNSVADGAADWDDMKMANMALSLFGAKKKADPAELLKTNMNKWRKTSRAAVLMHSAYGAIQDVLAEADDDDALLTKDVEEGDE